MEVVVPFDFDQLTGLISFDAEGVMLPDEIGAALRAAALEDKLAPEVLIAVVLRDYCVARSLRRDASRTRVAGQLVGYLARKFVPLESILNGGIRATPDEAKPVGYVLRQIRDHSISDADLVAAERRRLAREANPAAELAAELRRQVRIVK